MDGIVEGITAGWLNRDAVKTVAGFEGLPPAMLKAAQDQGGDGQDVKGVFHRGSVYLVCANFKTKEEAEELTIKPFKKMNHEVNRLTAVGQEGRCDIQSLRALHALEI